MLIHFSVVPIFREWSAELSWKLHREFVIVDDDPRSNLVLTVVGIACFAGVAVISEVLNQPINRKVGRAEALPSDYADLRRRWDRANLIRTSIAVVGLVCYVVAALEAA